MNENDIDFLRINIFVLGNAAVGKSSFILRFCRNDFKDHYMTTIGIDFMAKSSVLPNGKNSKICFYDTAGEEKYKSVSFNLIKNADGVLLMYDITNKESFDSINGWLVSIRENRGNDFPIILVGNKTDLNEKRLISKEDGEKEAEKNGINFFETSNKDGTNIDECVFSLASKIAEKMEKDNNKKASEKIKLDKNSIKAKKNKCKC